MSDLAAHPDFTLGLAVISPSARTVAGPGGTADVEPRVMQVLLVLADAEGQVVTRETLFQRCWGGVYVGDDSLNRAIAAVRKLASGVGGDSFEIETIPRTGYRLLGGKVGQIADAGDEGRSRPFTRRQLAAGAFGLAALGGIAGWLVVASPDREFDSLVDGAEQAVRKGTAGDRTVRDLRRAAALRPRSAKAWGLLAYVKSLAIASADPKTAEPARDESQFAARKALALDPKEPNALLAMVQLQGSTLDWATRDQRLREIIAIDPTHIPAIAELVLLTQAAGLNRESWRWNERVIELYPLSIDGLSKRALKLWIAGRTPDADKVIDQVIALYPTHPWPRWVRFLILALTDRARAAQAMFDARSDLVGGPDEVAFWRSALPALDRRSPETIEQARQACLKAAQIAGGFSLETVMILSKLGQVDTAFDIANGFLLSRGTILPSGQSPPVDDMNDAAWRISTQYLFTPPCAVMRADPRFLELCTGVGLTEYWRRRGVRPDY